MKKTIKLSLIGLTIMLTQACKKQNIEGATVIKDCTGVYIREDNKDYFVCNSDLLSDYNSGDAINVTFKEANACDPGPVVCMMAHDYEGVVEVIKIK